MNKIMKEPETVPKVRKDFNFQETILYYPPVEEENPIPHLASFLMPDPSEEGNAYITFQEGGSAEGKMLPPVSVPYACLAEAFEK